MPLVDMPLEQLFQYEGANECPAEFDAYWDKAIAEKLLNLATRSTTDSGVITR